MEPQAVHTDASQDPISILLVDDDPGLRQLIAEFLAQQEFRIFEAESGAAMRSQLAAHHIDILVIDVMMPGESGLSIVRELSGRSDLGIIMVSALGSETDRIVGLELGADDYLAKPVSPRELLARIRALLRRRTREGTTQGAVQSYSFAGWRLDPVRHVLRDPDGVVTTLSEGEFALLLAFVERSQRILTRDQLLDLTRGPTTDSFDRSIDTQISRIRRKLGTRTRHEIIRTVRNEGYIFLPAVKRITS